MNRSPEELRDASGELEVVLLPELGGRIHRLRAFGHDLLRTPGDPWTHRDDPFFWGAYPMAPWCNRARPGRREVAGREVDLRPNFSDGSAIHGLLIDRAWSVTAPGSLEVEVDDPAWPWRFAVRLRVTVDGATLALGLRLENKDDAPMPAGLGLHPWFAGPIDVRVPAASVYAANAGSSPEPLPVSGPFDLRRLAEPAKELDATWTDLASATVELHRRDVGLAAFLLIASSATPNVALASPPGVAAVALEPQTHGPDPLRRLERSERDAPILLPPGEILTLDLRLEVALARNLR